MVEVTLEKNTIAGIILAGGRARRLGGDKALRRPGPKPLVAHAIARATPQVASLTLSVNTNLPSFRSLGLPPLVDSVPDFQGPLAGIPAVWIGRRDVIPNSWRASHARRFFPTDLVARLGAARDVDKATTACAASGGRNASGLHAVAAIAARRAAPCLRGAGSARVSFPIAPFDRFFDINTPAHLARAEPLPAMARPFDNHDPGV